MMQDVGLACLSPGFQTQDPTLREQLQRSISVRDQQRSIIEARLLKTAKGDGPDGTKPSESSMFGNAPPISSKKRPPPGLSIVPPSAEQFAHERVIQSAPLNHTFTGRHQPNPMTRHVANQPSNLSHTSHIHHVPAMQTNNRLPPISDVFGSDTLAPSNRHGQHQSASNSSHSNHRPPFPSPGIVPHTAHPSNAPSRPREFRSAEEAVHEMTGGREELLPRLVHYGGHQPPTPPLRPTPTALHTSTANSSFHIQTVGLVPQAVDGAEMSTRVTVVHRWVLDARRWFTGHLVRDGIARKANTARRRNFWDFARVLGICFTTNDDR